LDRLDCHARNHALAARLVLRLGGNVAAATMQNGMDRPRTRYGPVRALISRREIAKTEASIAVSAESIDAAVQVW